ncbi:MAG: PQQ-binding-like beta-propeller repeat protein [Pirellulales bacterium]
MALKPVRWLAILAALCTLLAIPLANSALAGDWPMWRYDAGRLASSPHDLPESLHLQWTRQYSQRELVWDDPLNHDLMPYDRVFEPIVVDNKLIVNFNDADKIVALDVASGEVAWTYYAEGPVRFPAAAAAGKVYFTSDDGYLYCVDAASGKLVWRFRGAPGERKAIGNKRIISAWPARGAPVLRDGTVYFAASIWPFMGTFIYALDAETGQVQWVNDSTAAQFIEQPHSAPAFAGVAPQGALVATSKTLLVPGGRSVPAAFDRETGKFLYFNHTGKGNGGSFVMANDVAFFLHTRGREVRAFSLADGQPGRFTVNEPVVDGAVLYAAAESDGKPVVQAIDGDSKEVLWQVPVDGRGDIIKAGSRLYAAGKTELTAIELPRAGGEPRVIGAVPVEGEVQRLLAGGDRLFAVTLDGRIMAFGEQEVEPVVLSDAPRPIRVAQETVDQAKALVQQAGAQSGYALMFGVGDGRLLAGLMETSELQIVVVEPDVQKVSVLRRLLDEAGLYGRQVVVHHADPINYQAPPYVAQLVVVEAAVATDYLARGWMDRLYESVRPYGGALYVAPAEADRAKLTELIAGGGLPKAEVAAAEGGQGLVVFRQGALPGAADWTHQYGNIANTVKSDDQRVRLPLGVLWYGGNSNLDVLPRHGHGPPEQVIGGRLFIEGMQTISARDVYTGSVLWQREFKNLGNMGVYYDDTYQDTPLSTAYNQVHIPGANGRGTNYVATEDAVYVLEKNICNVVDPRTGENIKTIEMVGEEEGGESPDWGFIGVYGDVLLGGTGFAHFQRRLGLPQDEDEKSDRPPIVDLSASAGLAAFDRHSGELLWRVPARHSFLHNGIVAGGDRIYLLDRLPKSVEDKLADKGDAVPNDYRIVAVDVKTGEQIWDETEDIFGTWLGYSEQHDLILQAGASGSDRLRDEVGQGMATYRSADGSVVWKKLDVRYSGPCIIHNDIIITNANSYQVSAGAFNLLDGSAHLIQNPLTGQMEPMRITRTYGCNTIVASENLLTFRSGAAGFYDLETQSGTGNFGGFKSGCTSNLIVADGVLNAPDYTRTCSCSYQNQTSLALVPMPDVEMWTYSKLADGAEPGTPVERVGVNFGAPGDRRDEGGTLWIEYPSVGGDSPEIHVQVDGPGHDYFRNHAMTVTGGQLPWVAASGVTNVRSVVIRPQLRATSDGPGHAVAAEEDDTEESAGGNVSLTSSDLELVTDSDDQVIGVRFRDVHLQPGATIDAAYLQFTVDEETRDPTNLMIYAEASDDAQPFASRDKDVSSRARTQARVAWEVPRWRRGGDAGEAQRTPDLAPLIHEVISRPGWKPGGSIAFIFTGRGKRVAVAHGKPGAARLVVEPDWEEAVQPTTGEGRLYTVRLYFQEPEGRAGGSRSFDVALQGKTLLQAFDPAQEAGGHDRSVVREFEDVRIERDLRIELSPTSGSVLGPVLCGVELIAKDGQP